MKKFFAVMLLVFLASCGSEGIENQTQAPSESSIEVSEQIDTEVSNLPDEIDQDQEDQNIIIDNDEETEDDSQNQAEIDSQLEVEVPEVSQALDASSDESETVELSTTYNNPKIEVIMNIEYDTDSSGNITEISVTSPNYQGMPEFNNGVQAVVGMSVEEASEFYVSGSSLTTPAYQAAMKSSL